MATVIRTLSDGKDVYLRKVDVISWLQECALSQTYSLEREILQAAASALKSNT